MPQKLGLRFRASEHKLKKLFGLDNRPGACEGIVLQRLSKKSGDTQATMLWRTEDGVVEKSIVRSHRFFRNL